MLGKTQDLKLGKIVTTLYTSATNSLLWQM